MTVDAISAWCHRNHLLCVSILLLLRCSSSPRLHRSYFLFFFTSSPESESHLRDHLRAHLTRHPDPRNALFTWHVLTPTDAHLKHALHNPALVLSSRSTHIVWYIARAGRAQCPFARLGFTILPSSAIPKRKSPPLGAASVSADANRSTKMRITLRLPPKSLFPSRARPSVFSSQAPSRLYPHTHHRHHHHVNHQVDDEDDDNDNDDDDGDDDDDDDDESASDSNDESDHDLLHHSIISPVGPISIPTFRPAHDPLSIHVLCPFALDSDPPPDSEDEADDFHNSMLRQDIDCDFDFSALSIKHEFIPVHLPAILDLKQEDMPLNEWEYNPVMPLLPIATTAAAAEAARSATFSAIKAEESQISDCWSVFGSEREQSVASSTAFPLPVSPPSTSTEEDTMSPSPTAPSEWECGDTPAVKTEEDCADEPLSVPTPPEEEVFAIDVGNPVEAHPPHWEDGPICGPESVSPDDVDIFWGGDKRLAPAPAPAESSKMAAERATRSGRTRLHLHLQTGQQTLRRFSNATSEPATRVGRMCSISSVASDWTADDSECALLTPAHTGWKTSSNWKPWPLERQTTAIKLLPENKAKAELPIKVEPKEDELAIPASDKLKKLLTNSAFSANLHKANCPTIQTRVLLGLYSLPFPLPA